MSSTSIEQAMARMASSAADVPWLVSEVERLTRVIDAKPRQPLVVLNEYLDRAEKAETEVERLTDLCGEFRKREERLNAEVERLRGWIDRSERQEARARRAEAEVARLTAERDAAIERLERVIDQWRKTGRAVISEMNRADKAEAERDALAAQVAEAVHLAEVWASDLATDAMVHVMDGVVLEAINEQMKRLLELRAALADSEDDASDVDVCSGDADCTSELHVHDCFADSAGPCTDPDEHQPTDQED